MFIVREIEFLGNLMIAVTHRHQRNVWRRRETSCARPSRRRRFSRLMIFKAFSAPLAVNAAAFHHMPSSL